MAKEASKFKYRGRSEESIVRRAKESSGSYDQFVSIDALWFKSKEGENRIRIMPRGSKEDFDKSGDHWGIDVYMHYDVGPDGGSYLCAQEMKGEPCPVCEARHQAADKEEGDKMKASHRILAWLIDRSDEKAGPKLWAMPHNNSKDISNASQLKRTGGGVLLIDHPDAGYDVFFDREGEKMRTKYKRFEVDREKSYLSEDEKTQNKWLDYLEENPLSEILKFYEYDYIEKVLFGQSDKEDKVKDGEHRSSRRGDPPEEEDNSRRGSRRGEPAEEPETPRGGRRGAAEPEETETTERGGRRGREEPEEKEAEAPARGGRRGREEPEERETSTRGSSRRGEPEAGDGETDPEPETTSRGRTERVRPKEEATNDDAGEATERLGRLGRRGR